MPQESINHRPSGTDVDNPSFGAGGHSRRRVLGLGGLAVMGGVLAASDLGAVPRAGAVPTAPATMFEATGSVIAFHTDPHADPENATNMARLRSTLARIADTGPDLVIDGGDVTEYASPEEFEAHLAVVPDSIRERYLHVTGNHESRWDATALETYRTYIGDTNRSVTLDDLHLVLLDSTYVQEDSSYLLAETLAWLADDLAAHAEGKPVVLVQHYPVGPGTAYVSNAERLLEVLAPYDVRAAFMGHTHAETLREYNGITQVVGRATKNDAGYYRLTVGRIDDRSALQVDFVDISEPPADGLTGDVETLVTIDLGPRPASLAPVRSRATADGDEVVVQVQHRADAGETAVGVAVYDADAWGSDSDESLTAGTVTQQGRRRTWTARAPITELAPGAHRVVVHATTDDDRTWRTVVPFVKPGRGYRPLWEHRMSGTVRAGLITAGPTMIAADGAGQVAAFRPDRGGARPQWNRSLGPVWKTPALTADAATVVVGSSDRTVTALALADGSTRWRTDVGQPVVAEPLVATVANRESVVVAANRSICCLDAGTGTLRWRHRTTQPSMGRPATDGDRIWFGGGDGRIWCLDATNGSVVWSVEVVTGANTYGRMIYGPWDTATTLIGEDLVMFGDYQQLLVVRRDDGSPAWTLEGGLRHLPAIPTSGGLLVVTEDGLARLVDPATGGVAWETATAGEVSTALPQVDADTRTAWVVGDAAEVHRIDLAAGRSAVSFRSSTQPVKAGPALIDGGRALVVADLDGVLRGFGLTG